MMCPINTTATPGSSGAQHSTQAHINGYGGAAAAFPPPGPGGGTARRGVLAGGHDQRLPLP